MAVSSVQLARVCGTRVCPLRFTAMRALRVPGCVIALLGVAAAVAVIKESRDPLMHEGDLVELMTAAAYGVAVTVVLAGLGAAVALAIRRMPAAQAGARTLLDHPGRLEMLFAAGCLAAAFGLDAVREVTQHRKLFGLTFTEEALELTAAVALAVTCAEPLRARCW